MLDASLEAVGANHSKRYVFRWVPRGHPHRWPPLLVPRRKLRNDSRVELMFFHLDPRVQGASGIIREHGDFRLRDNLPGIHARIHIMHGAPRLLDPGCDRLRPGFQTRKLWQE